MSVYVSTYVWEHSARKGTDLLVLLAIADIANRNGAAWPSVRTISRYTRMSERNTQRTLARLVTTGELTLEPGAGPKGCNMYRVRMDRSLSLFVDREDDVLDRGDNLAPPDNEGGEGVTTSAKRGDTAMSPEPSRTVSKPKEPRPKKPAVPNATGEAYGLYSQGMKAKYGAEYPVSARTMGQLAQVIKRIGAEPAMAVIPFFFSSRDPYYAKTKHRLDSLVRDCERLWMELQVASGSPTATPTKASVYMAWASGNSIGLDACPPGDPLELARAAAKSHSITIAKRRPDYIDVRIGQANHRYSIAELTQPTGART